VTDPLGRALERHDVPLASNYIETSAIYLARAYLQITDAIAVMADAVAHDPAQPLAVLPLALPRLIRPSGVLWNKDRPLTPGAQLLSSGVEEAAATLGSKQA